MSRNEVTKLCKWVIWTSPTSGDYVRAYRVVENVDTVLFIKELKEIDIEVARYNLKDIKGYDIVE